MKWREVVGKFVVLADEDAPGEQLEGAPSTVSPKSLPTAPSVSTSGFSPAEAFDVSGIYKQEGISPVPFTAEQALAILSSLPEELSPETRHQVFRELLRAKSQALGAGPEAAVEDARRKVATLTAAVANLPGQVAEFVAGAESEIAQFKEQIQERRKAIEQAQLQEGLLTQRCRDEIERLTVVLELLG